MPPPHAVLKKLTSGSLRASNTMARGHSTIQVDRDEQLHLRKQLANVYNVLRDLGLNYKMTEIPGCSFITIERTEHKFSHFEPDSDCPHNKRK